MRGCDKRQRLNWKLPKRRLPVNGPHLKPATVHDPQGMGREPYLGVTTGLGSPGRKKGGGKRMGGKERGEELW